MKGGIELNDREKLAELYRLYEKPLYYIALAILHQHEQAEDAVSDAFYKIIRHIHKIGQPDSPETKQYMIAVIRSVSINQYRRNSRNREIPADFDEEFSHVPDPVNEIEERQKRFSLREKINELLSRLNETDQNIVLLHCEQGMPFGAIANELNMKESAVRKRFERARKRMTKE